MIEQDVLRRFLFEELGIRGEWVRLTTSWQTAKQHQQGPENAQLVLGQGLAAVVMLSATIKFNGSMILQAQGDGDVSAVVAQSTNDRKIRGLVRSNDSVATGNLADIFGQGRLVLTIEPDDGNPYQGIVPLEGTNLAAAIQAYFEQSEQLNTRLWLFADATQAVGLLLQELPTQNGDASGWERIEILANTLTEQELLSWDCEKLLYNLFNEDQIRLYDAEDVQFECACSRPRIERTLRALGAEELDSILKDEGKIEVGCQFCGEAYLFDALDVNAFMSQEILSPSSKTKH